MEYYVGALVGDHSLGLDLININKLVVVHRLMLFASLIIHVIKYYYHQYHTPHDESVLSLDATGAFTNIFIIIKSPLTFHRAESASTSSPLCMFKHSMKHFVCIFGTSKHSTDRFERKERTKNIENSKLCEFMGGQLIASCHCFHLLHSSFMTWSCSLWLKAVKKAQAIQSLPLRLEVSVWRKWTTKNK